MQIRFVAPATQDRSRHEAWADHARRRLQLRLKPDGDRVAHVTVRFGDTGSRQPGRDRCCVMQVQLRGAPAASVVDLGADAYATIDRAADRIARLVQVQLRAVRRAKAPPADAVAMAA